MSHIRITSRRGTVLLSEHVDGAVSVRRVERGIQVVGASVQPFFIAGEGIRGGKLFLDTVREGRRKRKQLTLPNSVRLSREE